MSQRCLFSELQAMSVFQCNRLRGMEVVMVMVLLLMFMLCKGVDGSTNSKSEDITFVFISLMSFVYVIHIGHEIIIFLSLRPNRILFNSVITCFVYILINLLDIKKCIHEKIFQIKKQTYL